MSEQRGNIDRERDQVSGLAEQIAQQLEQQVGPGAYLAGQLLAGTEAEPGRLTLHFSGGWYLVITGNFECSLVENDGSDRTKPFTDAKGHRIFGNKAINILTGDEIEGEVIAEEG